MSSSFVLWVSGNDQLAILHSMKNNTNPDSQEYNQIASLLANGLETYKMWGDWPTSFEEVQPLRLCNDDSINTLVDLQKKNSLFFWMGFDCGLVTFASLDLHVGRSAQVTVLTQSLEYGVVAWKTVTVAFKLPSVVK